MNIAIIPARGGSKRIPEKNIRNFKGKPMIAWSIEAAIASKLFDHIVVSTDDQRISEVARQFGAETPFMRPPQNFRTTSPPFAPWLIMRSPKRKPSTGHSNTPAAFMQRRPLFGQATSARDLTSCLRRPLILFSPRPPSHIPFSAHSSKPIGASNYSIKATYMPDPRILRKPFMTPASFIGEKPGRFWPTSLHCHRDPNL